MVLLSDGGVTSPFVFAPCSRSEMGVLQLQSSFYDPKGRIQINRSASEAFGYVNLHPGTCLSILLG
jgi:hypothetical protein